MSIKSSNGYDCDLSVNVLNAIVVPLKASYKFSICVGSITFAGKLEQTVLKKHTLLNPYVSNDKNKGSTDESMQICTVILSQA